MSLYDEWKTIAGEERSQKEYDDFWKDYFEKEKKNYIQLLSGHESIVSGTVSELAEKFGMDLAAFTGFLDGINTSLVNQLNLEEVKEDTEIKLEIDFEKLYFNMLEAKADWLYNLAEWDDILPLERRKEIIKERNRLNIAVSDKVGRNDPCTCGSGKKYKKCCGK